MPTVEVLDLHKRKVGSVELPGSVPAARSRGDAASLHATGIRLNLEARGGQRVREKALETKAHRPCTSRLHSLADMAARRDGVWSAAAQLCLRLSEEEISGCLAPGAVRETGGWRDPHCVGSKARRAQDATACKGAGSVGASRQDTDRRRCG